MGLQCFLLVLCLLSSASSSCDSSHRDLLNLAFSSVSGFHPPPQSDCLRELRLSFQNLSGAVSWMHLRNITTLETLDLSGNVLEGSIPGAFWAAPALIKVNLAENHLGGPLRFDRSSLRFLNLSGNRFTGAADLSRLSHLRVLDLSGNQLGLAPAGMRSLSFLRYLDVSDNSMAGEFPGDFPAIDELRFLNVSLNNLTGVASLELLQKFGSAAFVKAGVLTDESPSTTKKSVRNHRKTRPLMIGLIAAVGTVTLGSAVTLALYYARRRLGTRKGRTEEKDMEATAEVGWVAAARWEAAVVIFEKPLMELTFADLAAATSGFGRESLMAEAGRNGPVYRAVLPGDMHVVVRVLESARPVEEKEAAAAFRDIARLRHPNLLPLFGYCISGREKLLLYEYMERGDLHRWLHELPAARPHVEDWSRGETWENNPANTRSTTAVFSDWPTRHRIALGVARGLAFLHQGWVGSRAPVVHGHLVPSNILLGDDLEPRISDFAVTLSTSVGGASAEDDVYSYGVLVMELVTGLSKWPEEEVERVREMVRNGRGALALDQSLQLEPGWEKEAVECLRVGYLCTARSLEKRPAMQQVVALLKDIRPDTAASASFSC